MGGSVANGATKYPLLRRQELAPARALLCGPGLAIAKIDAQSAGALAKARAQPCAAAGQTVLLKALAMLPPPGPGVLGAPLIRQRAREQCLPQLGRTREARRRLLLQTAQDYDVQLRGDRRVQRRWGCWRRVQVRGTDLNQRAPGEHGRSGEQKMRERAQRIQVGARVHRL